MTQLLRILHREAELQRRFMKYGDIKTARMAAIAMFNEMEIVLLERMDIL